MVIDADGEDRKRAAPVEVAFALARPPSRLKAVFPVQATWPLSLLRRLRFLSRTSPS